MKSNFIFNTSLTLFYRTVFIKKIHFSGTLRIFRPMPNTIKNANPGQGTAVYMRKGELLCLAYKDADNKKPVRMLSTFHSAQELPSGRPKLVNSYNKNMGGVDTTDAIMKAYSGQRKNKKVHKKVILHLFHRILHNAYILYQKNTCDIPVKSRVKFLQSVVESLSAENVDQIPRRRARQRKTTVVNLPGKKEKDCCVCSDRRLGGQRRRSRTACARCGKGLHSGCVRLHQGCQEE